ncbi:MAG TPA: hypothetical protein EYN67_01235 [Flavobacteriales bacterium]|nr:hypothetical protein [Flavobacteriales bacterium]
MNELNKIACNLCAKRDGCMPYSDDDLIIGADGGHVPLMGECDHYVSGSEDLKVIAVNNLNDFNQYAEDLVSNFNSHIQT